ncbi:MAG: hypothetical protein ACLKAL_10890 [Alkaliphilus sp.]
MSIKIDGKNDSISHAYIYRCNKEIEIVEDKIKELKNIEKDKKTLDSDDEMYAISKKEQIRFFNLCFIRHFQISRLTNKKGDKNRK